MMNANISILDQQKIPYKIIKKNSSTPKPTAEFSSILLIQNKNISSSELLKVLDPMSLKITVRPYL